MLHFARLHSKYNLHLPDSGKIFKVHRVFNARIWQQSLYKGKIMQVSLLQEPAHRGQSTTLYLASLQYYSSILQCVYLFYMNSST